MQDEYTLQDMMIKDPKSKIKAMICIDFLLLPKPE